jgi:hypothetical protein
VTDEPKKDTDDFVEKTGAKYAYAYDKGGKLKARFGVSGIPHALLVDPSGKVVWAGHPASLNAKVIEQHLTGALTKPMWEWSASAKDAKAALQKRKYADALAAAAKIPEAEQGPAIRDAIQNVVKSRVEAAKAALTAGDFLSAQESGAELTKELEGLPEKADADKVVADVKANKDADKVLRAQKTIRDLKGQKLSKKKDLEKAMTDLKKIQKDLSGTYAGKEAEEFLIELQARKRQE